MFLVFVEIFLYKKGWTGRDLVNLLKFQKMFNKNIAIHPEAKISNLGILKNHKKPFRKKIQKPKQNKRTPNSSPL